MKNYIYAILAVSFSLFSCSKSAEIKPTYIDPPSGETANPAQVNPTSSPVSTTSTPVSLNSANSSVPVGLTPSSTPSGALNPEHGKPGHRCDIAVGAPLNSAPQAKPATQQINVNPNQTSITPQVATQSTTNTAPGMNPPHGEPGHRCDISVGAPLSSAPVKTATPTTNITATVPKTETVLPATVAAPNNASVSAATKTAPGMNPPHGEPGHQCGIPVGQPLK